MSAPDALALALAALPGWEWRPGMLVRSDDEGRDQTRLADGDPPPGAGEWPDLDDPTTVAAHAPAFATLAEEIAALRASREESRRLHDRVSDLRRQLRRARDVLADVADVQRQIAAAVGGD